MKIIHVMAGHLPDEAETYSTNIIAGLHKTGITQIIVAPHTAAMKKAGLQLEPNILKHPFQPWQKFRLAQLIHREKPDIVHTWTRYAAGLIPSGIKIPAVGWFGGYSDPHRFKRCTHFVGATKDITTHIVRNGVVANRTFFIPAFPTIETQPPLDRATLATPKTAKTLLTLSPLHPAKRLDTFLHALAAMPEYYAWIAGEGPLRRELEALAITLDVMDRVRFLGKRIDRAALLRSADMCVLPSHYEPSGAVIVEAWAAGTPLVACQSAATHVNDNVNGLLVPNGDANALAAAIRKVLTEPNLHQKLVAEGYAAYIRDYTCESVTGRWIRFYTGLVAARSSLK